MTGYFRRLADRTGLGRSAPRGAAASVSPLEVVEAATAAAASPPAQPASDQSPAAPEFAQPQDVHVVAPEVGPAPALRAPALQAVQPQAVHSMHAVAPAPPSQTSLPVVRRAAGEHAAPATASNSIPAAAPLYLPPRNDVPRVPAAPRPPAPAHRANVATDLSPPPRAATPTNVREPAIRELSERLFRDVEPARARPQPPEPFRPPVMAPRRQDPQPTVRIGSIRLDMRAPEPAPAQPPAPARSDPSPRPVPLRRFHVRTW
jgi:hypothetical protein